MEVRAIFDDADSAEIALVNLRALGIFPNGYKMRALRDRPGIPQGPMNAAGGIISAQNAADTTGTEGISREVLLTLDVAEWLAPRAKSALISNHARRVRLVRV